nr:2'-5' RNA ligase family protein [Deinococcus betulae]
MALLPPTELAGRVKAFRAAQGIQDAAAVPHVTVKARSGLGDPPSWLGLACAVAAETVPVSLTFGGLRLFGGGRALYLTVQSPSALALHLALLAALKPEQQFSSEGPGMTPHLTLALGRRGVDLNSLFMAAQREFADLAATSLTWTASELVWLRKPGPGAVYLPVEAWPLGGG